MTVIEEVPAVNLVELGIDFIEVMLADKSIFTSGSDFFNFYRYIGVYPQYPFDRIVAESVDFYYNSAHVSQDIGLT